MPGHEYQDLEKGRGKSWLSFFIVLATRLSSLHKSSNLLGYYLGLDSSVSTYSMPSSIGSEGKRNPCPCSSVLRRYQMSNRFAGLGPLILRVEKRAVERSLELWHGCTGLIEQLRIISVDGHFTGVLIKRDVFD